MCLHFQNFFRKTCTNSGWYSTNNGFWKDCSQGRFFCVKWTVFNGRGKICVNFKTGTERFNIVKYRHGNNPWNLIKSVRDWQSTRNVSHNKFIHWAALTNFSGGWPSQMKQLCIIERNFIILCFVSFPLKVFRYYSWAKKVLCTQ